MNSPNSFPAEVIEWIKQQSMLIGINFHQSFVWQNALILFPDHHLVLHLVPIPKVSMKNGDELLSLSEEFQAKNIRCIHLWEDVWINHATLIQSRIMAMLGVSNRIHGRQTKCVKLDKPIINSFLETNHLQGSPSAKFKYGLMYNDTLVAAASFSAGRPMQRKGHSFNSFELIRFANLHSHTVVGGLSKLLKHFIKEQHPDDIMTYADRDWSKGEGYEKLGFTYVGSTPPQPFWINLIELKRIFIHRLPPEIEDEYKNLNEQVSIDDFMERKGYVRIFNTGNLKYLLTLRK